jgi:hypothetical protein
MIFSTSSPSATTGGGQSNSPVCTCNFFDPRSHSVHFPCFSFCVRTNLCLTRYPSLLPLSRIGAHFGYRSTRPLPVQGSATENFTLSYRHNHETTITSQSPTPQSWLQCQLTIAKQHSQPVKTVRPRRLRSGDEMRLAPSSAMLVVSS